MFCYQCQETMKNTGCTKAGVCGKSGETADSLDNLLFAVKGIGYFADKLRKEGVTDEKMDAFILKALFTTITNVNFNPQTVHKMTEEALDIKSKAQKKLEEVKGSLPEGMPEAAKWNGPVGSALAENAGVMATEDEDIRSLRELVTYGLKGLAAYADHAYVLGYKNEEVFEFTERALAALTDDSMSLNDYIALTLETGEAAAKAMAMLDKANTESYGKQEVSEVDTTPKAGKAILISGHDLKDMDELLKQTEGKGINVYTHGEMLPANAYPAFKKYKHLKGNFGGSWWKQREEFDAFPGAILMTTNCIQKPKDSYKDRIFTTGLVSFDGVKHIEDRKEAGEKDFSKLIEKALESEGFAEDAEEKKIPIGFAHDSVLGLADKVIDAVKSGAVKKFVVMAGCDGRHKEREYFTEVAEKLPEDSIILTAGCAKYRYNMLDLGDIGGIPRVLDAGQCNDSYSLAIIAIKLKEAFGMESVNDLPLAFDIAWYEQKAVAVLLALLHLGFKNIKLGPTLPAFLSPNTAKVLIENFELSLTKNDNAAADVEEIMSA